ncbi:MAG: sigma 54-interacting transcriptional regulator [Melioribacteraceae bacterium]
MKNNHRYIESLIFSILIVALALFLSPTLKSIDDIYTDIKFNFRGKQQIDTSIVTLFFTDDDLQTLGGVNNLPNHTALIISALTNLGVKAIGINILFEEKGNNQNSERRHFISTVKSSPNVSLACYFQTIGEVTDSLSIKKENLAYSSDENDSSNYKINFTNLPLGSKLLSPYPKLILNEQIGHLNYYGKTIARNIPLLIKSNSGNIVPSFSLELMRVFLNVPKDEVTINENSIVLQSNDRKVTIPTKNGAMLINYSGSSENLLKFTVVDFLNSYFSLITGKAPKLPLNTFKNKIVLIAIDSEIQGQYLINPFNERMPKIGVQANAIDTILNNRFIYELSPWMIFLLSFILTFLIIYILLNYKVVVSFLFSLLLIAGYVALSLFLFSKNIQLPVHPILLSPLAIIFGLVYKLGIMQSGIENNSVNIIQTESETKAKIVDELNVSKSTLQDTSTESKTENNTFYDSDYDEIDFQEITKSFRGMVFSNESPLNKIVATIETVAPSTAAVLITGESGTGKELVANAIHTLSLRSDKNYVAINCATFQETLLESELFGYEKGAFTGADKQKLGLFETANLGTIFLDEISEMSETLQSKLLRVLQNNELYRVGGTAPIKIDVRIIAATNKDPHREIKAKRFREDLFYRLNTIHIQLPPLRNRKNDVPVLINRFLNKENENKLKLSTDAFNALLNYNWPGNVRQLESVIQRAVIFAKANSRNEIQTNDFPIELSSGDSIDDLETKILLSLREKKFSRNSISETAKDLGGLNRGTITEYIRGILLKELSNNDFDMEVVSTIMADTKEQKIIDSIKKKNEEYLSNIKKQINPQISIEENTKALKKKYKNLPKKYHIYLENFIISSLK